MLRIYMSNTNANISLLIIKFIYEIVVICNMFISDLSQDLVEFLPKYTRKSATALKL